MPVSGRKFAAALENAENVAGLRNLETRQRIEEGHNALMVVLLLRGRRHRHEALRHAICAVAFAVHAALVGESAVVVQSRSPQHTAVRHHALTDLADLLAVAADGSATDMGDARSPGLMKRTNSGDSWLSKV